MPIMNNLFSRVLAWFWVTLILTIVLSVFVVREFSDDLNVEKVAPEQQQNLDALAQVITAANQHRRSLLKSLNAASRDLGVRTIAVDVTNLNDLQYFTNARFPITRLEIGLLKKLVDNEAVLTFSRHGVSISGPVFVPYRDMKLALFVANSEPPPSRTISLVMTIILAVLISGVLAWWFARTLVKPIRRLQQASNELAKGNWRARVETVQPRGDELNQLALSFNQMATQLDNMWHGQQRLLADISHELRSPLARLQMALGLAEQQNVSNKALQRIEREAQRMEDLIAQLLTLSRAEAGALEKVAVPLNELLAELIEDSQFEASNHGKRVEVSDLPDTPVLVSENLVCSAIENVLRNAIHYAHNEVIVTVSASDDGWQVDVSDDGDGLSAKQCELIFAPFYRVSVARDRDSGGVGLGLAIAKAAVAAHQGTISAKPLGNGGIMVSLCFNNKPR